MSYVQAFMMQKEREAKGLAPIQHSFQAKEGIQQMNQGLEKIKNSLALLPANSIKAKNSGRIMTMGAQFHTTCKAMTSLPISAMSADEAQRHINLLTEGMKMLIAYAEANL